MSVSGRRTLKKYHYLQSTSAVHHVVLGCGERVGAQQAQDSFQSASTAVVRAQRTSLCRQIKVHSSVPRRPHINVGEDYNTKYLCTMLVGRIAKDM